MLNTRSSKQDLQEKNGVQTVLTETPRHTATKTSAVTRKDDSALTEEVAGAQRSVAQEIVGCTGAGESECMLAIVPVKVRAGKGGRYIETYTFMDPCSTATFCTEAKRKKLNVKGKPTQILISTMGQKKTWWTDAVKQLRALKPGSVWMGRNRIHSIVKGFHTQEHPCPEREHPKSTTSPKVVIPKRHKFTLH